MVNMIRDIVIVVFIIAITHGLSNYFSIDAYKIYPLLIVGLIVAISTKLDTIEKKIDNKK